MVYLGNVVEVNDNTTWQLSLAVLWYYFIGTDML